jgi:hypothetical protein
MGRKVIDLMVDRSLSSNLKLVSVWVVVFCTLLFPGCRQASIYFGGGWSASNDPIKGKMQAKYARAVFRFHSDVPLYLDRVIVDSLGNGLYRYAVNKYWRKSVATYPLLLCDKEVLFWSRSFREKYAAFLTEHTHYLSPDQKSAIKKYVERDPAAYGKVWMFYRCGIAQQHPRKPRENACRSRNNVEGQ